MSIDDLKKNSDSASSKKTIAIFGGAFDPVHFDHIEISKLCLLRGLCKEVWLMPSPDRWDKQLNALVDERFEMLSLALSGEKNIFLSDFEIRMGEYRGSYVTLCSLQEKFPDYSFRLLVGADCYSGIPRWRDPLHFFGTEYNGKELLKNFELIVFERNGFEPPDFSAHREEGFAPLHWVGKEEGFVGKYSSSSIRKELFLNRSVCPQGLPQKVYQYILSRGLYSE